MAEQESSLMQVAADDVAANSTAREPGAWQRVLVSARKGLGFSFAIGALVGVAIKAPQMIHPLANAATMKSHNSSYPVMNKQEVDCVGPYGAPVSGPINIAGDGGMTVNWILNAGDGHAQAIITDCNDLVVPLTARAYLTTQQAAFYDPSNYAMWPVNNQYIQFTVDVSGAGHGCVAAFYLVAMATNPNPGNCGGDYYCDSASVCGATCGEWDLMEANLYAFRSTAHVGGDKAGVAMGIGGNIRGGFGNSFTEFDYGPGPGHTIDSTQRFVVDVSFKMGDVMEMQLSQNGLSTQVLQIMIPGLNYELQAGATPVFSYWQSQDTSWFEGQGGFGQCGESVQIMGVSVKALPTETVL